MSAPISKHIRALYDDQGRVNANALAATLGQTTADIARAFSAKPDTLRKNPVSEKIQGEAQRLVFLLEVLTEYFGDWKSVMIWLRKPHQMLDDRSPLQVILDNNLTAIMSMVMDMREGIPG